MSYKKHLQKDKRLAVILKGETYALTLQKNIPLRLMGSIISQQLSTKVAAIIFDRFVALYPAKKPTLLKVLDTPVETLRGIGISYATITSMQWQIFVSNIKLQIKNCRGFQTKKSLNCSLK